MSTCATEEFVPRSISVGNLFLPAPDTDFRDFLEEVDEFAHSAPEIMAAISKDLDAHAREKKRLRIEDNRFFQRQTAPLTERMIEDKPVVAEKLTLHAGRPRMSPELVFSFLMIRAFLGGSLVSKSSKRFLRESMSLHAYLETRGTSLPGINTILENINQVSKSTLELIFDKQIQLALREQLDDFDSLTIDSTAVKANSNWPTDANVMTRLLMRTDLLSQKLHLFGLNNFNNGWVSKWLTKMNALVFAINLTAGKPKSKGKLKKKYRRLLKLGEKTHRTLSQEFELFENALDLQSYCPSQRKRLQHVIDQMRSDLSDVNLVMIYASERVFKEKHRPSTEKILSLSDGSAAYIQKGGRTAVIGYKPQMVRSANGFVTGLIVPEGNAADSTQLVPALTQSMQRSGIVAALVSTDDGYASKAGRNELISMGVTNISISGSKGKRLTDEADWNSELYQTARNDRSAVESLMFTIKDGFDFGELGRRGIEAVCSELTEKVLAYNFCRIILLKKRRRDALREAA